MLTEPTEIDVVISGGALRGYFMLGTSRAGSEGSARAHFSGTSAGAWNGNVHGNGVRAQSGCVRTQ